jgi:rod shape-determining protein MreC
MFSKKTVLIAGIIVFFAVNIVFITYSVSHRYTSYRTQGLVMSVIGPFQSLFSKGIQHIKTVWHEYFFLVATAEENFRLKDEINRAIERSNRCEELELSNVRLRALLDFQENTNYNLIAAEIVGKDPSPWFKSILINKGEAEGLRTSLPVIVPEGVVGIVTEVSHHYAKVLLQIDQNSAVDALVQRTRARGIVKGRDDGLCSFEYVLRRHDIQTGDVLVSSGLDGVFPKGLRVGHVSEILIEDAGVFQKITVTPYVDFETIEEVLIILNLPADEE